MKILDKYIEYSTDKKKNRPHVSATGFTLSACFFSWMICCTVRLRGELELAAVGPFFPVEHDGFGGDAEELPHDLGESPFSLLFPLRPCRAGPFHFPNAVVFGEGEQ